ncbi:hypothetical protein HZA42_02885 [Candidatus Peregrinibacteria bacterium]|nr:hypothetical protein [Candidatus Peregrinibacteria bacterium]
MEQPLFERYEGPGRRNAGPIDHLAAYVKLLRKREGRKLSSPRFRSEDQRKTVRGLVWAALRHDYEKKTGGCEKKDTLETLTWFDRLSDGKFNEDFPRGAVEGDVSRLNVIVDSLSKAYELSQKGNLSTRSRIRALAFARAVFGDNPAFMPKELSHFARFRGSDSLLAIQGLTMEKCHAAVAGCKKDDDRQKKLIRLESALSGAPSDDTITKAFFKVARVSGLNLRHTESPLF